MISLTKSRKYYKNVTSVEYPSVQLQNCTCKIKNGIKNLKKYRKIFPVLNRSFMYSQTSSAFYDRLYSLFYCTVYAVEGFVFADNRKDCSHISPA